MDATLTTPMFCSQPSATTRQITSDNSLLKNYPLQCKQPLNGSELSVKIEANGSRLFTLIKFTDLQQQLLSTLLNPGETTWKIPVILSAWDNAKRYNNFGIIHMVTGYDHLLFVACLFFICQSRVKKRWKALITTITGFTLGHSITLGLNTFGVIDLNIQAVEVAIALSIAFLAAEIIRFQHSPSSPQTFTYRYPAWVSTGFGLIHGFGFASLLNDYGLPQDQTFISLFAFNLGIEIGQLAFVAILVLIAKPLKTLLEKARHENALQQLPIYVIGSIAMFWFLQRIV